MMLLHYSSPREQLSKRSIFYKLTGQWTRLPDLVMRGEVVFDSGGADSFTFGWCFSFVPVRLLVLCMNIFVVRLLSDSKRYKEFRKQNTMLFYMPVWSLAELRSVGEYIKYDSYLIAECYERFGEIFRHIFQNSFICKQAENDQDSEMASADLEQLFSFARSIEVSETRKGNNISQYDVTPPKFNKYRMKIASGYVCKNLRTDRLCVVT